MPEKPKTLRDIGDKICIPGKVYDQCKLAEVYGLFEIYGDDGLTLFPEYRLLKPNPDSTNCDARYLLYFPYSSLVVDTGRGEKRYLNVDSIEMPHDRKTFTIVFQDNARSKTTYRSDLNNIFGEISFRRNNIT